MSDNLCEDLIIEIFTRLPPKPLLRFRLLSKSWYSCISSPSFIHTQSIRSPQKLLIEHVLYIQRKDCGIEDFYTLHSEDRLPLCLEGRGYSGITVAKIPYCGLSQIVGSCNGILCLYVNQKYMSLWNPSIRRKLTLPNCPRRGRVSTLFVGSGFGFDPTTDDYKIVSLSYTIGGGKTDGSFLYATKIGSWCSIACPPPLVSFVLGTGCFVDGALHWVVKLKSDDIGRYHILRLDLSTHVFAMIALPEHGDSWLRGKTKLTTIQGSLAVYASKDGDSWIWVRRDASWSVVFKSKTNQVEGDLCSEPVFQSIVHGDLLLYTYNFFQVQVYDRKSGTQSRLVHFCNASRVWDVVQYVESLELLDIGISCE